jgi:hypothetical protein
MTTALQEYIRHLHEAHAASEDVDAFDLHSHDPASLAAWRDLTDAFRQRQLDLIAYAAEHHSRIAAELEAPLP